MLDGHLVYAASSSPAHASHRFQPRLRLGLRGLQRRRPPIGAQFERLAENAV